MATSESLCFASSIGPKIKSTAHTKAKLHSPFQIGDVWICFSHMQSRSRKQLRKGGKDPMKKAGLE